MFTFNVMNKIVITALMAFMPVICYSVDIKGVISDIDGRILEYSSVRLTSVTDSVLAKSTVSDQRGEYSIGDIKPGKYLVTALCLALNMLIHVWSCQDMTTS